MTKPHHERWRFQPWPHHAQRLGFGALFDRVRWRANWASLALMAALAASIWQTILPSYEIRPSRFAAVVRSPQGTVRFYKGIEIPAADLERNKLNSGEAARRLSTGVW
jgi:hypothetical protein